MSGLCQCGCGTPTSIATYTDTKRGRFKGKPYRYANGHARRKSGVEYVVEDRGYKTPCWIWQLTIARDNGYGRKLDPRVGKVVPAHRIYWESANGPVPDGLTLDHLCRVRACVNPDHLEPVTHAENGRRARPITWEIVREIRRRADGKRGTIARIASELGLTFPTVYQIAVGKSWKESI